ncbi:MAG: hypothetical protein H0Z34_16860 [Brevibacillus sp.]|nr:hypothetical protein [Brevibacillus sp.]
MFVKRTYVLIAFAFLLMGIVIYSPATLANHPSGFHNETIHSSEDHERICVETEDSSTWSFDDALDHIRDSLIYNEDNGQYDGLADDKIYFTFEWDPCGELSSEELANVEMRVYVMDDTSDYCDGPYSCVFHYSHQGSHDGYNDYGYEKVYIRSKDLTNVQNYIVNHEFGHTLGLADGDGTCPDSIMHSGDYYCSGYPEGPTQKDQESVEDLANSTP